MKTRVLFVVESFSTGVYAIVRDIACNLDPNSFELRILHSLRSDSPTGYETDLAGDHITLRYIPMGSAREYPKAIKEIRKEIQKSISIHQKQEYSEELQQKEPRTIIFCTAHMGFPFSEQM
jgi:hypothetical protein